MIRSVQARWNELDNKRVKTIAEEFSLDPRSARKYIKMTDDDIAKLDRPTEYNKRKTVMDDYVNIIYKMLRDGIKPAAIMSYVIRAGYAGKQSTLEAYIKSLARNNFNIRLGINWPYVIEYPDGVTAIKRNELLRYITTKNPKAKRDATIAQYLDLVKKKYKIVATLE